MKEITVVTAFFDIGRKNFKTYSRTNNEYLDYFEKWARMENNLIIYTEKKMIEPIKEIRKKFGLLDKTKIIEIDNVKNIENEIYERMLKVSKDEYFLNFRFIKNATSNNAYYDYIMLLKYWFLNDATKYIDKKCKMMAWLDFGFNHGGKLYTNFEEFSFTWCTNLSDKKIHLFSLKELEDKPIFHIVQYLTDNLMGAPVIAPVSLCENLWELIKRSINSLLDVGFIDDDQLLLTMAYRIKPEIFEIHVSDWFLPLKESGAFHLTTREKKPVKKSFKDKYNQKRSLAIQRKEYLDRINVIVKKEKDK